MCDTWVRHADRLALEGNQVKRNWLMVAVVVAVACTVLGVQGWLRNRAWQEGPPIELEWRLLTPLTQFESIVPLGERRQDNDILRVPARDPQQLRFLGQAPASIQFSFMDGVLSSFLVRFDEDLTAELQAKISATVDRSPEDVGNGLLWSNNASYVLLSPAGSRCTVKVQHKNVAARS